MVKDGFLSQNRKSRGRLPSLTPPFGIVLQALGSTAEVRAAGQEGGQFRIKTKRVCRGVGRGASHSPPTPTGPLLPLSNQASLLLRVTWGWSGDISLPSILCLGTRASHCPFPAAIMPAQGRENPPWRQHCRERCPLPRAGGGL